MSFKEFKKRIIALILGKDEMAHENDIWFDENAQNIAKYNGITFVGRRETDLTDVYFYGRNHKYLIRLLPNGECIHVHG